MCKYYFGVIDDEKETSNKYSVEASGKSEAMKKFTSYACPIIKDLRFEDMVEMFGDVSIHISYLGTEDKVIEIK